MKIEKSILLTLCLPFLVSMPGKASDKIKVNQVGMYPYQEKVAVIEGGTNKQHFVIKDKNGNVVYKGKVSRVATSPWSGKKRAIADFSNLKAEGNYTFVSGNDSCSFNINKHALSSLANGVLHAYYYQRSGVEIEEKYAGKWHRPLAHPDTAVLIHESAATKLRPAGTVISSPYGWYDAGDFNKYTVNSAFTIGQILTVYQMIVPYFDKQKVAIPENGNSTADVLDEMMFNLKWLLTMQDPNDGGVYHKLTNADFDGMVMPVECNKPRYVVMKTTAATLDFAAVMALASRIYKDNGDYPDFSEKAAEAAKKAWIWANAHPTCYYDQPEMNKHFKPAVTTGAYDDTNVTDEFFWAATELYMLTKDQSYIDAAGLYAPKTFSSPSWGDVAGLAVYEWAINNEDNDLSLKSRKQIIDYAREKAKNVPTSNFETPCGDDKNDFVWGSLAGGFATPGITFLFAYKLTQNRHFINMAYEIADYILGRNATGYCYVTGFGKKSPMHIHHRISFADGIVDPVPGLLVGGPNPGQQDLQYLPVAYPSKYPDESYLDNTASYASNEIAINWNSAAVGLFSWLDFLQGDKKY